MEHEFLFGASARRAAGFAFWQMMRAFEEDGGKKLGLKPTHIVVSPGLEKQAEQLLNHDLFAEGNTTVSNEIKGRLKLIVADYL